MKDLRSAQIQGLAGGSAGKIADGLDGGLYKKDRSQIGLEDICPQQLREQWCCAMG